MALLNRAAILAAQDIATEEVEVPEWGGSVLVRGLTGRERDAYEATIISQRGTDMKMNLVNARAKLVSRAIVDADGKPLFGDEDVALLANKSAAAIERVFNVAQKLSGMSKDDLEDLTKNSLSSQSDDSGSA